MFQLKKTRATIGDVGRACMRRIYTHAPGVILMYHTVGSGPESLAVSEFRRQLGWLRDHGYHIVPLESLVARFTDHSVIPERTVVITFDDGYADNYSEVFPVLKEFSIPATIFLATGLIGTSRVNKRNITHDMLTWDQVAEMHAAGLVDFQPHTHQHIRLSYLSDDQAEYEIRTSQQLIEDRLQKDCRFFAYPFGVATPRDIALARKYFDAAVSVHPGFIHLSMDRWSLPRNAVDHVTSFLRFRLKV